MQDRVLGFVKEDEKGKITIMIMKMTPILAMHWHTAGRGFLLLMVVLACVLVIACWPGKSETK